MKKVLLNFGDSWAFGCELADPVKQNYCYYLGQQLEFDEVRNFSMPSSSIGHMVWQFRTFLDTKRDDEQYLASFFLTAKERFLLDISLDDKLPFTLSPRGAGEHTIRRTQLAADHINGFWYRYCHNDVMDIIRTNTELLALQQLCQHYKINYFFLPGWQEFEFWPEINQAHVVPGGCKEILNLKGAQSGDFIENPYIKPNLGHPNVEGHRRIAKLIHRWIKSNAVDTAI